MVLLKQSATELLQTTTTSITTTKQTGKCIIIFIGKILTKILVKIPGAVNLKLKYSISVILLSALWNSAK